MRKLNSLFIKGAKNRSTSDGACAGGHGQKRLSPTRVLHLQRVDRVSNDLSSEAVQLGPAGLLGDLVIPAQALGLVLFVHGSGSSRKSPRNRGVASVLQQHHLATLLFDLLTEEEALDPSQVFDIELLARRTVQAIRWVEQHPDARRYPLGLFGASTGAAAALVASVQCGDRVKAVVSRGGRPDLAGAWLAQVRAPTLLIVGGLDAHVLSLNQQAMRHLTSSKRLEQVPGAGHLFEEPGALSSVAAFATSWFEKYLIKERPS